jgi:hypothetical protein
VQLTPQHGAYVTLAARLQQIVATVPLNELLWLPTGELLVRLGVDGTTRWKQAIELFAVNASRHAHKAEHWHPIGLFLEHESTDSLSAFIASTGWEQELTNGVKVLIDGEEVVCVIHIVGDHMARVRLGECAPPSCTLACHSMCPYCATQPAAFDDLVATPIQDWSRWQTQHFHTVPPIQRPLDLLHGIGVTTRTLRKYSAAFLQRRQPQSLVLADGSALGPATLTDNHAFVRSGQWLQAFGPALVQREEEAVAADDIVGTASVACIRDLWVAHTALCQLLLRKPGDPLMGVAALRKAVEDACHAIRCLGWKVTPWLHMLYTHSVEFVEVYGSLWWFGCWGLEARHRQLKREYGLSLKKTRHHRSWRTGVASLLGRTNAQLAIKRLRPLGARRPPLKRRLTPTQAALVRQHVRHQLMHR